MKKNGNRDSAAGNLVEALQLMDSEIEWRLRAKQQLLPVLNEFDALIRNNIGLRLQPGLTNDQAKNIAACLANHKDISLAF